LKILTLFDLADADGAAEVCGLYEEGVGEGFFDEAGGLFGVGAPLAAEDCDVRGLREAGGEEHALHGILVHAGGGAEDAGADIGDVGELEETLDGAVFAEGAVEDGEDDIYAGSRAGFCGGCGDGEGFFAGVCRGGGFAEEGLGVAACEPAALLGDAELDDVVLLAVDCFKDGAGGTEGDFVLAALAAKQNAYA